MDVELPLSENEISCVIAAVDRWSEAPDVLTAALDGRASGYARLTRSRAAWLQHALADYLIASTARPTELRDTALEDAVGRVIKRLQRLN
jgi:hypothetical protein